MIDKSSPVPLYYQIEEDIIGKIEAGEYKPNERIDSEAEFVLRYGVSQITVRKALSELTTKGYLYRHRGKGTFIAEYRQQHRTDLRSFNQQINGGGEINVKLISISEVQSERIAKVMSLPGDSSFVKVKRVRLVGTEPIGVQTSYIPSTIASLDMFRDFSRIQSVYGTLRNFGIVPVHAKEKYKAVTISNSTTQKLLKAAMRDPAFYIERFGFDSDGRIFEYTESIMLGGKFELEYDIYGNT